MSPPEEANHEKVWKKSIPGRRDSRGEGQRVKIRLVGPCSLKKARAAELKMREREIGGTSGMWEGPHVIESVGLRGGV